MVQLAYTLTRLKNRIEAEHIYCWLLQIIPRDVATLNTLGAIRGHRHDPKRNSVEELGMYRAGLGMYRAGLQVNPGNKCF